MRVPMVYCIIYIYYDITLVASSSIIEGRKASRC